MSGHNKWAQIKHQKAITDAKKGKNFTKLVRSIVVEAKKSGGDLHAPGLRVSIAKAREANMPNDNIDRAIKKALGDGTQAMESLTYEAYGPGGIALIIHTLSDNRNKAAQEIKYILSQHGGIFAEQGSAAWAFERTGGAWVPKILTPLSEIDLDQLSLLVDALEENDEVQEVITNAE